MKKLALLSVSDKKGIVELAKDLVELDYQIIATGNTAKMISNSGIEVTEISSLTGFPEIFEGRVKTLNPKIFGGILFRRDNEEDKKEAEQNEITPIDIVCVNLYPFVKTTENPNSTLDDIIENIDIGGPSLIRASAKNYKFVSVLTNPEQYSEFVKQLKEDKITEETRKNLAVEAFSHTANYDTHIANYLEKKFEIEPNYFRVNYKKETSLRYGENPHQNGYIFGKFSDYFEVFHGKELSYNNILDLIAAVELVEDLGKNSCTIIKHQNPAGAAKGTDSYDAYVKALKCDPVSAFGGIVTFTSIVDEKIAEKLNEIFLEIISAPEYTEGAIEILKKKKNRRLLKQLKSVRADGMNFRNIPGGVIVQDADRLGLIENDIKTATDKTTNKRRIGRFVFCMDSC